MQERSDKVRLHIGIIGVAVILIAIIVFFSFALYTLQRVFGISIPYPEITVTISWTLLGLIAVWILGRTIEATTSSLIGKANASSVRKIVTVVLVFAVFFSAISRLGLDLSGYFVSLGATAIVVGFAAQATLGNLIAGMLVLISKPFRKGDYIRVNIVGAPIDGRIEEISFLRSRILTNDGVSISVPNTVMVTVPISNYTVFEKRPIILKISLDRSVSVDGFRSEVESAIVSQEEKGTRLYVKSFNESEVTIELWVDVVTDSFLKERSRIIERIKAMCDRERIPLKSIEREN